MATAEVDSGRAAVEAGPHLSPEERAELGRNARSTAPRSSHADWTPASDRPDPVALLEQQAATRVPELVPIRYGRMLASPFAFYRGAAALMAARPRGDAALRAPRPALRRRAPVELRRLRLARARARLRPERLRRDAAGPVGVGREAARGELRDRRPRPRLRRSGAARDRAGLRRAPTATRCTSFAAMSDARRLVRARSTCRPTSPRLRPGRPRSARKRFEKAIGEGAGEGQHAGVRRSSPRRSTASRGSSATRR